jgi:hypothetical protein
MTPEAQRTADDQWEARQKAWDTIENAKNVSEDAAIARAKIEDQRQSTDWQKYQRLMAQDNPNAANNTGPVSQMNDYANQPVTAFTQPGRSDTQWQKPGPGLLPQFGDELAAVSGVGALGKILGGIGSRAVATTFAAPALRSETSPAIGATEGWLSRLGNTISPWLRLPPGAGTAPPIPPSAAPTGAANLPNWMKDFNPGWEGAIPQKLMDIMQRYGGSMAGMLPAGLVDWQGMDESLAGQRPNQGLRSSESFF